MSRLIVKNLPQKMTQEKFKAVFASHGTITDIKLSFTKDGKFRRFGFVGFKNANEASKAKEYLNFSMLLNQKITVEDCKDFQLVKEESESKKRKSNENTSEDLDKKKKSAKIASENLDLDFLKKKKIGANKDFVEEDASSRRFEEPKHSLRLQPSSANTKLSENQIVEFFYPVKPLKIKILKTKSKCKATVDFMSENDLDKALKFNGDCINGKAVKLYKVEQKIEDKIGSSANWKDKVNRSKVDIDEITESGRLFVRNLAFLCTEDDLETFFGSYGPLSEVHIPIDPVTRKNMGIGFITFMFPEHAMKAFNEVDGTVFQGRMIHVLPSKVKPEPPKSEKSAWNSSYKNEKAQKDKSKSQQAHNWNTLFIGTDAVAGAIAEKYNVTKGEFLNAEEKGSTAVRVALGETQIVQETRQFLLDSGISLDSFSQPNAERSKSTILAKNLPAGATSSELRTLFEPHGDLGRLLLAPSGVTAVIEFLEPSHARQAFVALAYRKFHFTPLYLEWAPTDVFSKTYEEYKIEKDSKKANAESESTSANDKESTQVMSDGATIFVKNLNFETTEDILRQHFCTCGEMHMCTISKKKTHKKEELLSMGYGFVQYKRKEDAENALKTLQNSLLDGHKLELKISKRSTKNATLNLRKKQVEGKQMSAKILVRNVPFQADRKEIASLFKTFGELKSVRMPKKLNISGQAGTHRGFAFVDFITKQDAEKAFQALCHSTHLYGRRLVLEWADTEEESIEGLRRKTAERFDGTNKKVRKRGEFEQSLSMQSQ